MRSSQCARGDFRRITRWEGEAVLDRIAIRLAARPWIVDIHRETIECPSVQSSKMNRGALLMRGLDKAWVKIRPSA